MQQKKKEDEAEQSRASRGYIWQRAMAAAMKSVVTVGSSMTVEEAKKRALDLYRQACRALPQIVEIYNLSEVITTSELRSVIASQFRKHADVTNPKVIDMLCVKGDEELRNCIDHSKQRHHIIGQYVIGRQGLIPSKIGVIDHYGDSEFLKKFYNSNNF